MGLIVKTIIIVAAICLHPGVSSARGIVINAVGDIMLAGSGSSVYSKNGYGYPFAATASALRSGDIAVCNLEIPIAVGGQEFTGKRYHFKGSPQTAAALRMAGFKVATIANNHMMDFGVSAMEATREHLHRAGIACTGAGKTLAEARKAAIVPVRGVKVAFLAYSLTFPAEFYARDGRPGTAPGFARYYREDIATARTSADFVVVSFHWGTELQTYPNPYQEIVAHGAIDAGADLVVGHHPHVLQGIERYKNGVIFYSLGNFAFGSWSRSSDRSVIARITLGNGVEVVELIPLNVLNTEVEFQPRPLKGRKGQEVIDRINRLSRRWNTIVSKSDGRFMVQWKRDDVVAGR